MLQIKQSIVITKRRGFMNVLFVEGPNENSIKKVGIGKSELPGLNL